MKSLMSLGSSLPHSMPVVVNTSLSSLLSRSTLQQPFVVGPAFSPIPAKMVNRILARKYVDLCDQLTLHIRNQNLRCSWMGVWYLLPLRKKSVTGRVYWHVVRSLHHFSMILTSHFPHRWRDLMSYKLLILRTHRQFTGRVCLAYDKAFREHAAVTNLIDWSSMNVQLYNFCIAGASVRCGPDGLFSDLPKPFGVTSSQVICRSWNTREEQR